jgi:peptidoglycan/LPS O-acetylase OafA/YrhL
MKSPNIRYLPAVDHLRGMAALLIVYYHALLTFRSHMLTALNVPNPEAWIRAKQPLVSLVVEGHTAVGFFMVLSGFIFTFGAWDRDIGYWQFLKNRVLRIYPLYLVVVVVATYACQGGYTFTGFLQTLLFQSNLPGAFAPPEFLGIGWAIAVEFQFYLVFPFLIRFTKKYGARYLVGLLVLVWALRYLAQVGTTSVHDLSYWTIVGRMDTLIIGMLMGILYVRRSDWHRKLRYFTPAAFALVLSVLYWLNHQGGFLSSNPLIWFFWPTIEGLAWAAFAFCYLEAADWLPAVVSRALAYIGELSFSIYIIHDLVLVTLKRNEWLFVPSRNSLQAALIYTTVVAVPAVLVLSSLTYFTVEKPFLELRKKYLS